MASFSYFNVVNTAVTTIAAIQALDNLHLTSSQTISGSPRFITICNKDADGSACTIDLYIDNSDSTSTIYMLHDVVIPGGSTLVLERPEINYDAFVYALKFELKSVSATQLIDIKLEY